MHAKGVFPVCPRMCKQVHSFALILARMSWDGMTLHDMHGDACARCTRKMTQPLGVHACKHSMAAVLLQAGECLLSSHHMLVLKTRNECGGMHIHTAFHA